MFQHFDSKLLRSGVKVIPEKPGGQGCLTGPQGALPGIAPAFFPGSVGLMPVAQRRCHADSPPESLRGCYPCRLPVIDLPLQRDRQGKGFMGNRTYIMLGSSSKIQIRAVLFMKFFLVAVPGIQTVFVDICHQGPQDISPGSGQGLDFERFPVNRTDIMLLLRDRLVFLIIPGIHGRAKRRQAQNKGDQAAV